MSAKTNTQFLIAIIHKFIGLIFLACILTSISSGQNKISHHATDSFFLSNGENIFVDYASFKAKGAFSYVEFYVQMSYRLFSFAQHDGEYRAVYEIDLNIEDDQGNFIQSKSAKDIIGVAEYGQTQNSGKDRLALITAWLKPGNYRIKAVITDRESGKQTAVARDVWVRDFSGADLQVSDIQFGGNIEIDHSASPFVKNNRRVEPEVLHRYGHKTEQLHIYYEIYNLAGKLPANAIANEGSASTAGSGTGRLTTTFLINDEKGNTALQQKLEGKRVGASLVQSLMVPIDHLPSGQYTLIVRVFDHQSGSRAETSGFFTVYWLPIELKDYSFEEVLHQLHLVAGQAELKQLASLPVSEKKQGLVEFWRRRDTTPATPKNEMMEEFYRRIHEANARFKWENGQGWKSPQGEIYAAYGAPNKIQRFTSSKYSGIDRQHISSLLGSPYRRPYNSLVRPLARDVPLLFKKQCELWEYLPDQYFIFADLGGKGVYRLVEQKTVK